METLFLQQDPNKCIQQDFNKSVELYIYLKLNNINVKMVKGMIAGALEVILINNYKLSIHTNSLVTNGEYAELCLIFKNSIKYRADWGYQDIKRMEKKTDILEECKYISEKINNESLLA